MTKKISSGLVLNLLALLLFSGPAVAKSPEATAQPAAQPAAQLVAQPAAQTPTTVKATPASSIYDFAVKNAEGKEVKLSDYKNKVVLIVNVASRCGFTNQYEGLEKLYSQYAKQGLVVLGFPSNQFNGQEPGTNEEIQKFCKLQYGVNFPVFAKIEVKGSGADPLYKWLTTQKGFEGDISWNFNKFLIGRDGKIVERFGSMRKPEAIEPEIKKLLATK